MPNNWHSGYTQNTFRIHISQPPPFLVYFYNNPYQQKDIVLLTNKSQLDERCVRDAGGGGGRDEDMMVELVVGSIDPPGGLGKWFIMKSIARKKVVSDGPTDRRTDL